MGGISFQGGKQAYGIKKYEQETIITFNNEEELCEIETPVKALQTRLEKKGATLLNIREFENSTFKVYQFPKEWLIFQKPKPKKKSFKPKPATSGKKTKEVIK